ncbi:hypothetical protein [Nitrospira lenta]|uniref:Uncharacterized protein n=1 Tax=Nitrospira lenta TaxID=1436998 RepID=A0A330L649_9BACT|nr:hypothetical protein [Nitrospira lenta]SPP65234.1 hypothetical protein NITLEN_30148 [Nitrospira lenta]
MMMATVLRHYRPALVIPLMVIGFWLISYKGCVPDQDLKPTPALAIAATPLVAEALSVEGLGDLNYLGDLSYLTGPKALPPSGNAAQSLLRAAKLLKQAAPLIDKNEHMAVQFIREAIAILKRDVILALNAPESDKISGATDEHDRARPL